MQRCEVDEGDGGGQEKSMATVATFSSSSLEEEPLEDSMSVSQSPIMYAFPAFLLWNFFCLPSFFLENFFYFFSSSLSSSYLPLNLFFLGFVH
jgi:hypothetical protein